MTLDNERLSGTISEPSTIANLFIALQQNYSI